MKNLFSRPAPEKRRPETSPPLYWIIPSKLAVGPLPTEETQTALLDAGIQSVLTLCAETEGTPPEALRQAVQWNRWMLPDSHYDYPLTVELLKPALEIVRQSILDEKPTYVHCLAGMERSPTVCIAYLCQYEGMQPWEALNWVKQSNPRTSLTSTQVKIVQALMQS
jgi:protein-tyrosine phosphatase